MKEISFFFQEKGAGLIDGRQIGEYLGAKLNPREGYEEDVCIFVKQIPPEGFPAISYVNVVDGVGLIPWIAQHPSVGIIVTSLTAQSFLARKLRRDDIVFIPEHHCNYSREKRTRIEVTTVGMIGNIKGFNYDLRQAAERFEGVDLKFVWKTNYSKREDVVDFYKGIDIQVNWRPHVKGTHAQLHNPLKLANAGSFGIPTVSYAEDNYEEEFRGYFYSVRDIDQLFKIVGCMKDNPSMYKSYADLSMIKSEYYHIENVARMYEILSGGHR